MVSLHSNILSSGTCRLESLSDTGRVKFGRSFGPLQNSTSSILNFRTGTVHFFEATLFIKSVLVSPGSLLFSSVMVRPVSHRPRFGLLSLSRLNQVNALLGAVSHTSTEVGKDKGGMLSGSSWIGWGRSVQISLYWSTVVSHPCMGHLTL